MRKKRMDIKREGSGMKEKDRKKRDCIERIWEGI